MTITKIADVQAPVRAAGGDNEVPRDGMSRPRIIVDCWLCDGVGRRKNVKTGNMNKCSPCGPQKSDPATANLKPGQRLKAYTRTTTYIDVLDDKSNLEAWQMRMVLVGVAADVRLLDNVSALHAEFLGHEQMLITLAGDSDQERREEIQAAMKTIKDELNRRAQVAKEKAGAEAKADLGTLKHGYSELVDQGLPLPVGASFGDVIDMDAYRRATVMLDIVHMEKLLCNDQLAVAGTPDRISQVVEGETLTAPDGYVFKAGELIITDLKTGTVEYGALKMAMQLGFYSRSKLYDHKTGERTDLGNINQKWGIIMNVRAGTGIAELFWADLELGWEAVEVAGKVRDLRSRGRKALVPFTSR